MAPVTPEQRRQIRRMMAIAQSLDRESRRASECDIALQNGAKLSGLLGATAEDLRQLAKSIVEKARTA